MVALLSLSLSACTLQPGVSPTPPSSIPEDGDSRPTSAPVPPPEREESAYAAAYETLAEDENTILEIVQGSLPPDSLKASETGDYLALTTSFLNALLEDETIVGASGVGNLWLPDHARSSASTLERGGESYPFGWVQMMGCFQVRWEVLRTPDAPAEDSTLNQLLPYAVELMYEPSARVWLITNETDLGGTTDAPNCSSLS